MRLVGSTVLAAAMLAAGSARADCVVFGDSIGLGLGKALAGLCPTEAQIGILSSVVASRVTAGDRWTIVSLGSNDYPAGITPEMAAQSKARVVRSLDEVHAKVGKWLLLILPANGGRAVVQAWAAEKGVPAISFEPGADGIHPRKAAYDKMAEDVRAKLKELDRRVRAGG